MKDNLPNIEITFVSIVLVLSNIIRKYGEEDFEVVRGWTSK